jgi:hypothetical protein
MLEKRRGANKKTRTKSSSDALAISRVLPNEIYDEAIDNERSTKVQEPISPSSRPSAPPTLPPNPFGIGQLPSLTQLKGL